MPLKILVVEDNFITSDEILDRLHSLGYSLCEAAFNGQEALEKAAEFLPDLALMDINLGDGLDGIETAARIREDHSIPIIYLTAYDDDATLKRAQITAPYAYITKPFSARNLHIAIEIARDKHAMETQLREALRESQQREREITELSERLRAKNAALEELNATKDRFFSIIAHDIKNPFAAVLTGAEALKHHLDTHEETFVTKMAHQMHIAAQRVYKLLENLLTWAQTQQGTIPYAPQDVELALPIQYCQTLFKEHALRKRISIINTIQKNTSVYADREMLSTIFRNLLSNAIKFTPEDHSITISSHDQGDTIEIAVTDTGIGMSDEELLDLFQTGQKRSSNPGTHGERGTGLGLILCKEFVEKHGGHIWAESEEGKGSTFRFTLPKNNRVDA